MISYEEEGEKLADTSACAGVRADLKMCLLESDCCKKDKRTPRECLQSNMCPSECQVLRNTFFECKRSLIKLWQHCDIFSKHRVIWRHWRNYWLYFTFYHLDIAFFATMDKSRKKPPSRKDLPHLMEKVPKEHKDYVKDLSLKMLQHPAYGQSYDWTTRDFEMGAPLGRGKFGRVYLARERSTHYMVAMKVLFKAELQKGNVQRQVLREIEIQSRLKHPHILRLLTWFHDTDRIYLALELASQGELFKILRRAPKNRFDEPQAAKYTYQVADALHYCHLNNVIHRDLKPENILLTAADDVKLADFGWSAHTISNRRKTLCGTLDYLPPEMVDGRTYDDSVDQWCLGILCYEFLTGGPPFESTDTDMTYSKIQRLEVHYPSYLSSGAKDVIANLLRKSGSSRITLVDVMQHVWVKKNMEKRNKQLVELQTKLQK